jgi:hypothetical protein
MAEDLPGAMNVLGPVPGEARGSQGCALTNEAKGRRDGGHEVPPARRPLERELTHHPFVAAQ